MKHYETCDVAIVKLALRCVAAAHLRAANGLDIHVFGEPIPLGKHNAERDAARPCGIAPLRSFDL